MNNKNARSKNITPREGYLMAMLHKVINEYKFLLNLTRKYKPLKIIEINHLSNVPGETIFSIQITNKNCIAKLSADEIIINQYNLDDFSKFHANMIRHAAKGTIINYLQDTEDLPKYKILSKRMDKEIQQYIFTIEDNNGVRLNYTAYEISRDKNLLANISIQDIFDIGFTQGFESILKEKSSLLLAKKNIGHK